MKNRTPKLTLTCLLFASCIFLSAPSLRAQTAPDAGPKFDKTEHMIAMRDGVQLHTVVFTPKNLREPLPILFTRTPYGVADVGEGIFKGYLKEEADEGYIFAFQDIRGRYQSQGTFRMLRPQRAKGDPKAVDESTDAYDSIDWMVRNVPHNNGRVGMFGTSYDGWLVVMAALDPHPALKAATEEATPADMFLGDDFHHNGAFRLSYGFEYTYLTEYSTENANFKFDRYDTYDWYLDLGALSNVEAKYFHGRMPTWSNFVSHPNYDSFWKQQALVSQLTSAAVPLMHVAGWWDQEDFYGPVTAYEALEKADAGHKNFLVVGPWNHGGWYSREGSKLGNVNFDSPTSRYFRENIQRPWFAYFLKDKGTFNQPEALTFQTGSNKWDSYTEWPPRRGVAERNLYFHPDGRLSFEPPREEGDQAFDSYVSDPAHPVPYRPRPVEPTYNPGERGGSRWYTWLLEDQRFVSRRPDVLTWETQTLNEDTTITGDIVAHLFASTSGTDGDWVVKLIDVYPEEYPKDAKMGGYQLMIADEILRGRFRNGFERPEPVVPNQVNEYVIDLHTNDHRFLKGHRIMVQVQSTWFPLYDRNPQKFVPSIYEARDSDYQPATQRVFRSKRFASHVTLPLAMKP